MLTAELLHLLKYCTSLQDITKTEHLYTSVMEIFNFY